MLSTLKKILNSIALIPTLLALCFILIGIFQIMVDFSIDAASPLGNLVITKKEDVQFVLAFIIGGIFTLTIFSYTMVMNVLNRNISNYSPRLIPLLLSEKHHQLVLGFSSGTILYAMLLAIPIASSNSDSFPKLGASLGIFFSIICVFLFIYFIHTVSQSIHINHILKQVFLRTEKNLNLQHQTHQSFERISAVVNFENGYCLGKEGYLHQPEFEKLIKLCSSEELEIHILKIPGQFIYRNDILFKYSENLDKKQLHKIAEYFAIDNDVPLQVPETGFKHLVEVAVKGMSPAINDPGTAKSALDYFTQLALLRNQMNYYQHTEIQISKQISRRLISNEELFDLCFLEMHHYMKEDPLMSKLLEESKHRISTHS